MNFIEYANVIDDKNYKIVETYVENVLTNYNVTYSFAGRTLTENLDVTGLSKKTSKKKLDTLKKTLKEKVRIVCESVYPNNPSETDLLRNNFGHEIFPLNWFQDAALASEADILGCTKFLALQDPFKLQSYLSQAQDMIATLTKMEQMNRVNDLNIRIAMVKLALAMKPLVQPEINQVK